MNWKINILTGLCIIVFACNSDTKKPTPNTNAETAQRSNDYTNAEKLIEVSELKGLLASRDHQIIHFGKPTEYGHGHIPGALNIWRSDIEDQSLAYSGMMAPKEQIEKLFSGLGIYNGQTLLVYDSSGACDAARLWWVLENYGYSNLRILNGGVQAWKAANGELNTEIPNVMPSSFSFPKKAPMDSYISHEQMLSAVNDSSPPVILDTRTREEFSGKRQKNGAVVAGRIPNSHLINWDTSISHNDDKKFKSYKELEAIYAALIPDKDQAVIAYCHTGVRSAQTIFVLKNLLGYNNIKNFDGSWTEWSQLPDYPKVKDSITTIFN